MTRQKLFLVTIPRYSIFAVLLFLAFAIIFYEGGTMNDPTSIGYSFTRNFFSDLGKYTPENMTSMILFASALTICGATFIIYFFYFIKLFTEKNIYKSLSIVGCIFGMFGGLCFFGVGITPSNTVLDPHIFFANWAFRSFLITSILLTVVLFKDKRFNKFYAGGYSLFGLLIFIYVLILELAPSPRISDFSLMFNVVSQKAIVLVFICSVLMQSFGNLKIINDNYPQ